MSWHNLTVSYDVSIYKTFRVLRLVLPENCYHYYYVIATISISVL